jgi:hypothetical protein
VFLALTGLASIGAVPFWFIGRRTAFLFGIPVWLWTSMAFTVALSALTVWGLLRFWRDDELD